VGFVAVVWGADRFVYGAAGLASNFGVSRLVIGLTIVAFGTSAPEMLVSGMAAAAGSREMGIGNAVGSNITNVTLVLGAAALVHPLTVHSRLLIREIPVLFLSMAVGWAFLWDGELSRVEGIILFCGMFALIAWISMQGRKQQTEHAETPSGGFEVDEIPDSLPTAKAVATFLLGLVFLLIGRAASGSASSSWVSPWWPSERAFPSWLLRSRPRGTESRTSRLAMSSGPTCSTCSACSRSPASSRPDRWIAPSSCATSPSWWA
jgi:cation:H+ antiporter